MASPARARLHEPCSPASVTQWPCIIASNPHLAVWRSASHLPGRAKSWRRRQSACWRRQCITGKEAMCSRLHFLQPLFLIFELGALLTRSHVHSQAHIALPRPALNIMQRDVTVC